MWATVPPSEIKLTASWYRLSQPYTTRRPKFYSHLYLTALCNCGWGTSKNNFKCQLGNFFSVYWQLNKASLFTTNQMLGIGEWWSYILIVRGPVFLRHCKHIQQLHHYTIQKAKIFNFGIIIGYIGVFKWKTQIYLYFWVSMVYVFRIKNKLALLCHAESERPRDSSYPVLLQQYTYGLPRAPSLTLASDFPLRIQLSCVPCTLL